VVDISHPSFEDHIASVNQTLQEMMRSEAYYMVSINRLIFLTKEGEEDQTPSSRKNIH
jgi:GTP-binding protein HflX